MVFFGVAAALAILLTAGAFSIYAEMDLARRFDRICHRASKHHLASRTQLAHLGSVARYRAEPQECRSYAVGIFRATNHLDESGNLSAVVRRIDLVARFPRRPALSRHRFHLPDRTSRIHRHAWEKLLPRPGLSDVICRWWRCLRKNFRAALPMAQTRDRVSGHCLGDSSRAGRSSSFTTGKIGRLYACDSFRSPAN